MNVARGEIIWWDEQDFEDITQYAYHMWLSKQMKP